ncbi:MAG: hypothetical protein K5776_07255 [Lachnospiraceae bacterium]|nr:hypothetical protein [Lachnospiraceae bacterium]
MSNDLFNKALSNFAVDFAAGDAVRAFTDKGYSAKEIHDKLDFPIPVERIRKIMWEHLLDTNVILLSEPGNESARKRVNYEKVQDKYGHTSFKQVIIDDESSDAEYAAIDFGKRLYKDREAFIKKLEELSESDREYVLDLPWPLETVWHAKNERIKRILITINKGD